MGLFDGSDLVEQNAKQSLNIADRGLLIETGRIVGRGSAAELKDDPAVRRAYFGAAAPSGDGATGSEADG